MSLGERAGTVVVVARDATYAARLEAALRDLAGWRVEVSTPARLPGLVREPPDAVVALALGEGEMRRALRAMRPWARRPAIVALSDHPGRLWTSASWWSTRRHWRRPWWPPRPGPRAWP